MAYMFPGYQNSMYGSNNPWMGHSRQNNSSSNPQWEAVQGKVVSSLNSTDVFSGNEILEISVSDASRADAPSIILGKQKIPLQAYQRFPIRFQFYYDKSRAGSGYGGSIMEARIKNRNGQLLYINDTRIPLTQNVQVDVKRV